MSDFTVTIEGMDDVVRMLERAEKAVRGPALRKALLAGGMVAETFVKQSIQTGPKGGRSYKRGKKMHQASAAGQPPATDTGFLVNSIVTKAESDDTVLVSVGAEYGASLEYGTSRMAARPFLRPVADGKKDQILDAVRKTITDELERQ